MASRPGRTTRTNGPGRRDTQGGWWVGGGQKGNSVFWGAGQKPRAYRAGGSRKDINDRRHSGGTKESKKRHDSNQHEGREVGVEGKNRTEGQEFNKGWEREAGTKET